MPKSNVTVDPINGTALQNQQTLHYVSGGTNLIPKVADGNNQGDIDGQNNYGDWLVVSKPRKKSNAHINFGKGFAINSREIEANNDKILNKNKFNILTLTEEREGDMLSQQIRMEPGVERRHGKRKLSDRPKRQCKEPAIGKNTATTSHMSQTFKVDQHSSKSAGKFLLVHDKSTSSSKVDPLQYREKFKEKPHTIYELSHGIKTTMPAKVLGPNHIQYLEDPDPPDAANRNNTSMSMNDSSKKDGKDIVDFVGETPYT